jgi:hypothetical protein
VDSWIRNTLVEDALVQPPAGAWERLRKAISDRKIRTYGMWILDEPWHDPADPHPMSPKVPTQRLKLYPGQHYLNDHDWQNLVPRDSGWGSLIPLFPAWVNW